MDTTKRPKKKDKRRKTFKKFGKNAARGLRHTQSLQQIKPTTEANELANLYSSDKSK